MYPECLMRMIEVAEADRSVAVVAALQMEGRFVRCSGLPVGRTVYPGAAPCRLFLLEGNSVFGTPSSMLFRSDLVRSRPRFYDEVSFTEDVDICFDLLQHWNFGFVHQVLGYIRVQEDSITGQLLAWDPWPLHHLMLLERYGRIYLSTGEFRARREALWYRYAHTLGRGLLKGRGADFVAYQREGFRQMGMTLTRRWRALAALVAASDYFLNPKCYLEQLWLRRNRRLAME
jgi:hypothetical protein